MSSWRQSQGRGGRRICLLICLGLFSEYETVMTEDRNGLRLELGHVYMVEVDLRKA